MNPAAAKDTVVIAFNTIGALMNYRHVYFQMM